MKRPACDLFSLSPYPSVSQKDETIRMMSKSADRQLSVVFKIIHVSGAEGFLGGTNGKEPACQCKRCRRCGFNPWVRKISWGRKWQPTPVFLPGESCGQRSLAGYSPWGCIELDMAT